MPQRAEVADDVLDHSVHPVSGQPKTERDGVRDVVRPFEGKPEETPHPRADQERMVASLEVELEEEVLRRKNSRDGGNAVHLEALLVEEELKTRHLVHQAPRVLGTDFGDETNPMNRIRAPAGPLLHARENLSAKLGPNKGSLGLVV